VESATVDNAVNRLWGEVNGIGQNKLGQLLMEVRSELAEIEAARQPEMDCKIESEEKKLVVKTSTKIKDKGSSATLRRTAAVNTSN
jgi:hypothetical protein